LGSVALLGGIILTAMGQEVGAALLVCGFMINLVLMFPTIIWPFLSQVLIPALSDCSSTKLLTIFFANAFALMGLIAWMALQPAKAGTGALIGIIALGASLAMMIALGIFYWVCMKQGWFEAPHNDEDLSPTTAGSPGAHDPFGNLKTGNSQDAYAPTADLEANRPPNPKQAF